MDRNALAGMVFTLILAAMVGGFILLYPLSKRLGLFLDAKLNEKRPAADPKELEKLWTAIDSLQEETRRLNERQEFAERMLESATPRSR